MKKLILAQVLTTNGTAECSGLYDENGDPVTGREGRQRSFAYNMAKCRRKRVP